MHLRIGLVVLGLVACRPHADTASQPPPAGALEADTGTFPGPGGVTLHETCWVPDKVRAVLMPIHGLRDHGGRYGELALGLAERGIATCAVDLPGHGRSSGERVFPDAFADYIDTVRRQHARVKTRFPDVPIFVMGHSMGGALVTAWTLADDPSIAGLVLSAPALHIDERPSTVRLLRRIGSKHPHARIYRPPRRKFSRDASVLREIDDDPLIDTRKIPARVAIGVADTIERIQAHERELTVPLLVLHGDADAVTNPIGSRRLVESAASQDKTLKLYPGLYHDLAHEPERAQVIADIVGWIDARVSRSASRPG